MTDETPAKKALRECRQAIQDIGERRLSGPEHARLKREFAAREAALKAQLADLEQELATEKMKLAAALRKLGARDFQVGVLERELTEVLVFAPRCKTCGKACEPQRWVYAIPTCYGCLPPPPPPEALELPESLHDHDNNGGGGEKK